MLKNIKLKQKFHKKGEYNTGNVRVVVVNPKILFTATAAMMMIFMNIAVGCVKATEILVTTNNVAATAATMARTLLHHNARRNPIIARQSPKTLPPQIPLPSLLSFPMSSTGVATTTSFTSSSIAGRTNNGEDIFNGTHSNSNSRKNNNNSDTNILPSSENMNNCKSITATWGDVDPNIFYLCDIQTKQPLSIRCPEGKGYFNGLGYSGCIPYDQWPACMTSSLHNQVHICDSDHMQQPWETVNPNKFYICLQETTEPMLLNCGSGKGFVHAIASPADGIGTGATTSTASASEIVGCANWEKWRSYMKCTDYY